MGELAGALLLSRSGLTRLVDRLERQGMVARERCEDDARGYFAVITDAGRRKLDERPTSPLAGESASTFSSRLTPDDLDALAHAWSRVATARTPPERTTRRPKVVRWHAEAYRYAGREARTSWKRGHNDRRDDHERRAAPSIDRDRIKQLTEQQMDLLAQRTPRSKELYERAVKVMPGGVPSSFQENDPWPVYLERGTGSRVWDVDGSEYTDFHNGFGVMCIGHANPTVGAAVKARHDEGTHFAAPTDGSIVRRRGAGRSLRPAAMALHQLRAPSRRWTPSTSRAAPPTAT